MKALYFWVGVGCLFGIPATASAQMLEGQVLDVNRANSVVTILRSDTQQPIFVYTTNESSLGSLKEGVRVAFETFRDDKTGMWEASDFKSTSLGGA